MAALMTWAGWLMVAVLVTGLGSLVWAGASGVFALATVAVVSGVGLLVLAWLRARTESRQVRLRHCLECGASVLEKAVVCPRCQSVRLEEGAAAGRSARRREGREMPVSAYSSDASGVIGWVDAAPPGSWGSGEGTAPRVLRRWGMALIGTAAILAAAGVLGGQAVSGG